MRDISFLERVPNSVPAEQQRQVVIPKTIPFDYVFQFELAGKAQNRVQDVVEISSEGIFVALSIGYSLVPKSYEEWNKTRIDAYELPGQHLMSMWPCPTLVPLFPIIPGGEDVGHAKIVDKNNLEGVLIAGRPGAVVKMLLISANGVLPIPETIPDKPRIGQDGMVAITFANPIPLTDVLAVQAVDITNHIISEKMEVRGEEPMKMTPFIGPDPFTKKLPKIGDTKIYVYGLPDEHIELWRAENAEEFVPIENYQDPYTFTLGTDLDFFSRGTGKIEISLQSNVDDGDPTVSPLTDRTVLFVRSAEDLSLYSLFTMPYKTLSLPVDDFSMPKLWGGLGNLNIPPILNIPPSIQRTATSSSKTENIVVAPDEVSFLYSLDMLGSGRELQNKPIHNLAGLGNPTGDRPFRPFAKPMLFEPRSTLRIQVEELYCPKGTLHMVLHGYKILGTTRVNG